MIDKCHKCNGEGKVANSDYAFYRKFGYCATLFMMFIWIITGDIWEER